MQKILLTLKNGTEMELSTYIRSNSELRPLVTSYEDAVDKLALMTAENLSDYTVKYGDETITTQTGMEVESVRFPAIYKPIEETDVINIYVKLRKAL